MTQQGRLTEWNDERGFGFITPLSGGQRLFVHVSEFPRELRRPEMFDLVAYDMGTGRDGRPSAVSVRFLAPTRARETDQQHHRAAARSGDPHQEEYRPLSAFELGLPAVFALVLVVLAAVGAIPALVLAFYAGMSALAFVVYWDDKRAALQGRWRTSESTLLGVALFGGWPGAFLARHLFRHKTHKQPFRTYFWIAVVLNCLALVVVVTGVGWARG